jgi:putative restriction endonuclease
MSRHWTADAFIRELERLRTAGSKDKPALHKPLLLLLLLSRFESDTLAENTIAYAAIESDLRDLLRDFGWKETRGYHPEYPFHYLTSDGFWEYSLPDSPRPGRPSAGLLREGRAAGSLAPGLFALLRSDRAARRTAAEYLLNRYWPKSYHEDICARLGLALPGAGAAATTEAERKRSALFAVEVVRAYEFSCAFCGFKATFGGPGFGLDAAHVRWFTSAGPDGPRPRSLADRRSASDPEPRYPAPDW